MIDAGVENPDSKAGIDFCVNECPYSYCVVFERTHGSSRRADARAAFAKALKEHGVSVDDIALILRASRKTVRSYLKR